MAKRTVVEDFVVNDEGIIEAGKLEVRVSTGKGTGTDKVQYVKDMTHYLDYAGCKLSDLADSAAGADVVSLQNSVWRDLEYGITAERGKTTSMKDWYDREITRGPQDPLKAIAKLSGKALEEAIRQMTEKLAAEKNEA